MITNILLEEMIIDFFFVIFFCFLFVDYILESATHYISDRPFIRMPGDNRSNYYDFYFFIRC